VQHIHDVAEESALFQQHTMSMAVCVKRMAKTDCYGDAAIEH